MIRHKNRQQFDKFVKPNGYDIFNEYYLSYSIRLLRHLKRLKNIQDCFDIIRLLIENGANINHLIVSNGKKTPLDIIDDYYIESEQDIFITIRQYLIDNKGRHNDEISLQSEIDSELAILKVPSINLVKSYHHKRNISSDFELASFASGGDEMAFKKRSLGLSL